MQWINFKSIFTWTLCLSALFLFSLLSLNLCTLIIMWSAILSSGSVVSIIVLLVRFPGMLVSLQVYS